MLIHHREHVLIQASTDHRPLVNPHGGRIVNRLISGSSDALPDTRQAPFITLSERSLCDLVCIATGAFSPLSGFMSRDDYHRCLLSGRLSNGTLWPIPIVLPVSDDEAVALRAGSTATLIDRAKEVLGFIEISDIYPADHPLESAQVYKTDDINHPGVAAIMGSPATYVGGVVSVMRLPEPEFPHYSLTPMQTREHFASLGWSSVVGFQTRNPVHRAHEYLQKVALEIVDGLLLHPLVGTTKGDDIPASVRMRCYEALIQDYYPKGRAVLSIYPGAMRYAGPREAVLHAIVRKNYGCSHFIVGRDHAGVGSYYGPFDAQRAFDDIEDELALTILRFDNAFWCNACEGMATVKTCPHGDEEHMVLSGTKVRALLRSGQRPPREFSRPEVADILINALADSQPSDHS